jgi:hypothetical protein
MLTIPVPFFQAAAIAAAIAIGGCSPKFNWRDYRNPDVSYTAMFPAKAASYTRPVNLGGVTVKMTMTAAEVDGVTFAIGNAEMHDPDQARQAVTAIKTALVSNIAGTVKFEKATDITTSSGAGAVRLSSIEILASGVQNGSPALLHGRFVAKGARVYQVIVVGREANISGESVKTFMESFKPN